LHKTNRSRAFSETVDPGVYTSIVTSTLAGSHTLQAMVGTPEVSIGSVVAKYTAGQIDFAGEGTLFLLESENPLLALFNKMFITGRKLKPVVQKR
jgi:hypothetical protein